MKFFPDRTSPNVHFRHTLAVRVMHWINALAFVLMLMSGLQIFNAHPALNWGESSYNGKPPVLELASARDSAGNVVGVTTIFGTSLRTTGVLGASRDADGELIGRGFPAWATLPGPQWLAMARRWHFFFAWVLVINGVFYVSYSIATRHLSRDLWPDTRDRRSIGSSIIDHLRFRHPRGEASKRYNVLQKITYLIVIFILLPMVIATGMALSPMLDAALPGWVGTFGGRQSARTLHFLAASLLTLFLAIHLLEVLIGGALNQLRSMITGYYRVPAESKKEPASAE